MKLWYASTLSLLLLAAAPLLATEPAKKDPCPQKDSTGAPIKAEVVDNIKGIALNTIPDENPFKTLKCIGCHNGGGDDDAPPISFGDPVKLKAFFTANPAKRQLLMDLIQSPDKAKRMPKPPKPAVSGDQVTQIKAYLDAVMQ